MLKIKSKTAQGLLGYLFLNPHLEVYLNAIAQELDLDKRNLAKTIKELTATGLVQVEAKNNSKAYSINRQFPLYKEYLKIFTNSFGLQKQLTEILLQNKNINHAYIFGSYAKDNFDEASDIDLMVVGDFDLIKLQTELAKFQKKCGREINLIALSKAEFDQKQQDPFIKDVLQGKKINLL